jgi:hypothetical protein
VAEMELGESEQQIGEADTRAELAGVGEQPHLVETQSAVDDELVGDLPFFLRVNTGEVSGLRHVVGDRDSVTL